METTQKYDIKSNSSDWKCVLFSLIQIIWINSKLSKSESVIIAELQYHQIYGLVFREYHAVQIWLLMWRTSSTIPKKVRNGKWTI